MKKFLNNPWTIGLGTTFFGFLLTIIWDRIKGIEILSTVKAIISFVYNGILAILNFEIKLWWLLIGIAVLILGLYIALKIAEAKSDNQPAFLSYTKDKIQGWLWEWDWIKNYYGQYEVKNLHPICENCGTPLVSGSRHGGGLECLRCKKYIIGDSFDIDHVQLLIYDNARRNMFPREDKHL